MNHLKDFLGVIALFVFIFGAQAIATDAGEYAAPAPAEIEADIQTQRVDLCNVHGWPKDELSQQAFHRACSTELTRNS